MTWHGWLTLATELLILGVVCGALARLGGVIYRLIRAEIRIARIQLEKDAMWELERQRTQMLIDRRATLDPLATSLDKAARRIVH